MIAHARHYALYRCEDGRQIIMAYYEDDKDSFVDEHGKTWNRVRVTASPVYTLAAAERVLKEQA